MSDIIIIYPKGSEYPKVTNENLQNANYISAVINAEDTIDAALQLQEVNQLIVSNPEINNKVLFLINDTTLGKFPESTLGVLQKLKLFIQVTTTEDLEVTLATAIALDAMLVFPAEFIQEQHSDFVMLTLISMKMNNRLITRLPKSAEKLSL